METTLIAAGNCGCNIANEYTEIDSKSLEWLEKTVIRNGGQIQTKWINEEFISSEAYGEEI